MNNSLLEFVEKYKNKTFEELSICEMDALVLANLAYQPCTSLDDESYISDLFNKCVEMGDKVHGAMAHVAMELLGHMKDSVRYKDLKVYGVSKEVTFDVQFGGITFRNDYFTYVAYEGTSSSMIGWVENFLLPCDYPTQTQKVSVEYLNKVINDDDLVIYVGGHSKGGNAAMCAVMECNDSIFDRINNVYNFDGPGFRSEEFNSDKFERMNNKCINILPDGSMVGILLNNKNYNFIQSRETGFKKHYSLNWIFDETNLIPGEQEELSKGMQMQLASNLNKVDINDYRKLVYAFKNVFKDNYLITSHDLNEEMFINIKNKLFSVEGVPEETKYMFFEMIKTLLFREK